MADKQSRLAEIYKSEKEKGGGVLSTFGKRTKEKLDPRQFFNQKGFAAAILPSVFKSYSATSASKNNKISNESGFSPVSMNALKQTNINTKIIAKESLNLSRIAFDINLMKQNTAKLVKAGGGKSANKGDMFFKKAGDRNKEYESKFSKAGEINKSPTKEGGDPKDKEKSIFSTIVDGISSLFTMKGALIAGILAAITFGINEYFTNDEFKTKVDSFLGDMFETIKNYFIEQLPVIIDFMKDHWKELALAFALLFPKTTMGLISSGLSLLANILGSELVKDSLIFAFRSLVTLLSGPAGLIILLGGALFSARKLYDANQEEYLKLAKEKKEKGSLSEKDEARLKQLNSPANEAAAEKQLGYNPMTNKAVTQKEADRSMDQRSLDSRASDVQLRDQATEQLMNEAIKAGKNPSDISNGDIDTRFNELKKQRDFYNSGPNESAAESKRLGLNSTTSTSPSQDSSRNQIEAYLGKAISDQEYDALLKATGAEAASSPMERAAVASVILNRAKKSGGNILGVLNAPFQFQAITGPDGKSGTTDNPWSSNAKKVIPGIEKQIADNLSLVPKGLDSFTSAVPAAYGAVGGQAKFDKKMAEMQAHGGQQIGQTIFASGMTGSTSASATSLQSAASGTGKVIASASSSFADTIRDLMGGSTTNVTNNNSAGGGNSSGGSTQTILPSVYNDDFSTLLLRLT
jgi:hypothetical protein